MKIQEWFRYFFRKTYPAQSSLPNEVIDALGEDFDKYLRSKFDDEQILKWYPTSLMDIVKNINHPFKHHGFSLPLAYHFTDYVEIKAKESLQ